MKTCPQCSTQNDDTKAFCSECGGRLPEASSQGGARRSLVESRQEPAQDERDETVLPDHGEEEASVSKIKFSLPQLWTIGIRVPFSLQMVLIFVLAFCSALWIQMTREPEGVLPPVEYDAAATVRFLSELEKCASAKSAT